MDEPNENLFESGNEPTELEQNAGQGVEETSQPATSLAAEPGATGAGVSAQPAEPAAPAVVKLSPETIEQLRSATSAKAPAQPVEPQLTPEQIKQLLNIYEAGEKDVEELGLPSSAAAKLNQILAAVVKQAVTAASVHTEAIRRQFQQAIGPLEAMRRERELEGLRGEFFKANTDLAGKDKIVEMVYAQLTQSGWQPKNKEEAFNTVAAQARQLIKEYLSGNDGSSGQSLPPRAEAGAPVRKMPTVTAGGQAVGATSGKAPDKESAFNRWLLDM